MVKTTCSLLVKRY